MLDSIIMSCLESRVFEYFSFDKKLNQWIARRNILDRKIFLCRSIFRDLVCEPYQERLITLFNFNYYNKTLCKNFFDTFEKSNLTLLYYNIPLNLWIAGYCEDFFLLYQVTPYLKL